MNLLPPALAALSFLMSGGPGLLKRQFDPDPANDPTLTDWGKTAGWTALGAAAPMGLPALPQAAAGLFLSGGLGYPGRILDRDPNNNPSFGELLGTGMAVGLPFAFPPKAGPLAQTVADMGTPPPRPTTPAASAVEAPAAQVAAEAATPAAAPQQSILERLFADPVPTAPVVHDSTTRLDDALIAASKAALDKGEPLSGPTAGPLWQQAGQLWRQYAGSGLDPSNWPVSERRVLIRKMADAGLFESDPKLLDNADLQEALTAIAGGRVSVPDLTRYLVRDNQWGPARTTQHYNGPNVELKADELKSWLSIGSEHGRRTMESRVRAGSPQHPGGRIGRGNAIPSNTTGAESFRVYGRNNPVLEMPPGHVNRQAPTTPSLQEMLWAGQTVPDSVSVPAGMHDASAFTKTVEQVGTPAIKKTRTAKPKTQAPAKPAGPPQFVDAGPGTLPVERQKINYIRKVFSESRTPNAALTRLVNEGVFTKETAEADYELFSKVFPNRTVVDQSIPNQPPSHVPFHDSVLSNIVQKQGRTAKNVRDVLEAMLFGPAEAPGW